MKKTVTILALFVAIGLSGCATTKDLDAARMEIQQANTTAEMAMKTANEAKATADEAKAIAQDAKATADDAKATSATTEDKLNRMFKKAMYK